MAINRWKKYVIGMSSVALIGGTVGLAQKIDSFNNPVATNTTTDTTGTVQANTQDPIQQEFVVTDPNAQTGDVVVEPAPTTTSSPNENTPTQPTPRPVVRTKLSNPVQPRVEREDEEYEDEDKDEYAWEEREHEDEDDDEGEHERREHGEYERQSYSTQQSTTSKSRIRSQAS